MQNDDPFGFFPHEPGGRCMSQLDVVKEELIRSNESFRHLHEEHLEYKKKLGFIRIGSLHSEEEENEIKRIKLHKLTLKDKMEAMMHDRLRFSM
jgi:uncharacterized protein YdcH (DUF465 family)